MTQTLAIWIAGLLLVFLAVDAFWLGWNVPLVLGRHLVLLVNWMAFWR